MKKRCLYKSLFSILTILTIQHAQTQPTEDKPYLWVYWENVNRPAMPAVISLCRKTVLKHCKDSFNVVELDDKNIYTYLPQLQQLESNLNLGRLKIAQKVDFYRIYLLKEHGGVYLDSDMIVMRDLQEIANKLKQYDYIGFGEYQAKKKPYNSYGAPQNWAMASQKNGLLVNKAFENCLSILQATKHLTANQLEAYFAVRNSVNDEVAWHSLGKALIKEALSELLSSSAYKYYHYSSNFDGTRDITGKFIKSYQLFTDNRIMFKNLNNLFFVFTSHQYLCVKEPLRLSMTEEELLAENTNFAHFLKISLNSM